MNLWIRLPSCHLHCYVPKTNKRKTSFKELIKFSVTIMIVDLFQYFSFTCLIA